MVGSCSHLGHASCSARGHQSCNCVLRTLWIIEDVEVSQSAVCALEYVMDRRVELRATASFVFVIIPQEDGRGWLHEHHGIKDSREAFSVGDYELGFGCLEVVSEFGGCVRRVCPCVSTTRSYDTKKYDRVENLVFGY